MTGPDPQPPPSERGAANPVPLPRNPGAPLQLDWVLDARADPDRIDREVAALPTHAFPPAGAEATLLLRALGCIDLTTLSGDDTPARVRELCGRARNPLPAALERAVERVADAPPGSRRTAAVCVYHHFLDVAKRALEGSDIPVAVVSAGFPAGLSPLRQRVDEIRASVAGGADEIDAVINRSHVLSGEWRALDEEVRAFREACGPARLKLILGTGDLRSLTDVARTARLCLLAGADYIKTSTGKEAVNATYPVGHVMLQAIVDYRELTGQAVGFKAAGGIRAAQQALAWMRLVEEGPGPGWVQPALFRIGASGLLGEIVHRLQQLLTGDDAGTPPPDGAGTEGRPGAY